MMKVDTLIRLVEEAAKGLADVDGYCNCRNLVPSYNALLTAAKDALPEDAFLRALQPLEKDHAQAAEMRILFGQLRIALESLVATAQR